MKKIILLLCLLLSVSLLRAQLNNTLLSDHHHIDSLQAKQFGLMLSSFNYLRNTEYFNPIESGQTLFGSQLTPGLWLQTSHNTKLRAGVFLDYAFGSPGLQQVLPVISLLYGGRRGTFIFGTLNGATAHRIIEPLFNINSAVENRIEQGAQFTLNRKNLFLDAWINWQSHMPYRGNTHERFTAGLNLSPQKSFSNGWTLGLPLQFMLFHKGGQLSTDSTDQYSAVNVAVGLQMIKPFTTRNTLQLEYYFAAANRDISEKPFGTAHYTNLSLTQRELTFMLSHFYGNDFNATQGTSIYQSQSRDHPDVFYKNRHLLFFRLMYNKALNKQLNISARLTPFYDFNFRETEFSYSLYLFYRFDYSLGKVK